MNERFSPPTSSLSCIDSKKDSLLPAIEGLMLYLSVLRRAHVEMSPLIPVRDYLKGMLEPFQKFTPCSEGVIIPSHSPSGSSFLYFLFATTSFLLFLYEHLPFFFFWCFLSIVALFIFEVNLQFGVDVN